MTPPPTLLAIATTGGPAVVRAFWFDAEAARSQIVRFDESHIPMGVDAQFAGFDALLRRRLRAQGAAIPSEPLILEVEGDVDAGASWQLGLATAHLLAAAGALVFDAAQAERRLLATGRLGTSAWDVKPVDGLEEKLAGAAAFLTPAPDCSTGFVLPQPMAAAAARAAPPGAQVVGLETLDALARALGAAPTPTAAAPARTGERRAALLGAALLAAAAGAFALRDAVAPRAPDVVAPRAPDVAALGAPDLAALGATADAAPEAPPDARSEPTAPGQTAPEPIAPEAREPPPESALLVSALTHDAPAGCRAPELAASFGAPPPAPRETPLPPGRRIARDAFDAPLCGAAFRLAPGAGAAGAVALDVAIDPPGAATLRAEGPAGPVEAIFSAQRGATIFAEATLRWADDPDDSPYTRKIHFEFHF